MSINHRLFLLTSAGKWVVFYVLVLATLGFFLLPTLWMIVTSLKMNSDNMVLPPKLAFTPTLFNYMTVLNNSGFMKSFLNSFIISGATTVLSVMCSATSSYAYTRFRLFGSRSLSNFMLIARMIPPIVLVLPLYIFSLRSGLLDTYFIMVIALTTFSLPFQIWLLLGFFSQIPRDLDEVARIDGCSWFGAFIRVILPVSAPGLAATCLLTFFYSYNDLLFGIILSGNNVKPVSLAVMEFMGRYSYDWGAIMASGVLLMIPTLIIGIVFQRYMIQGMTAGAVKG